MTTHPHSLPTQGDRPIVPANALVLRHVAFEDLGILAPLLSARSFKTTYLDAGVDLLDEQAVVDADLVVVLGGPIGVYDTDRYPFLLDEITALTTRMTQHRPTLGICLGAQLMARALGAAVHSTGRTEIGYAPIILTPTGEDSVLAHLTTTPVLHWHGDEFTIPVGAENLAETPGFPHQAFTIGRHALALQFHLEADPNRIEQWLIGHAHELATAGIDPARIREDAAHYGAALTKAGTAVLSTWLDHLDPTNPAHRTA